MGMRDLLVALHPKPWRERYGEEFRALLDDTDLTLRALIDVVTHAATQQVRARLTLVLVIVAIVMSASVTHLARQAGLTDNILWAPTTPRRALALSATLAPGPGCWSSPIAVTASRLGRTERAHRRHLRPSRACGLLSGVCGLAAVPALGPQSGRDACRWTPGDLPDCSGNR